MFLQLPVVFYTGQKNRKTTILWFFDRYRRRREDKYTIDTCMMIVQIDLLCCAKVTLLKEFYNVCYIHYCRWPLKRPRHKTDSHKKLSMSDLIIAWRYYQLYFLNSCSNSQSLLDTPEQIKTFNLVILLLSLETNRCPVSITTYWDVLHDP